VALRAAAPRKRAWHLLVVLRFIEVLMCTLSSEEDKLCAFSAALAARFQAAVGV
jgi:hypothetical protein